MGWRDVIARRVAPGDSVFVSGDEHRLLEASIEDASRARREIDLIGWRSMVEPGSSGGQDMPHPDRLRVVREARSAWEADVLAGRAVDLVNQFTLGRGVPMPRAQDPEVQKVIEEAWGDPDNKAALTGLAAQLALNTDLTIQSNLFVAFFDSGDDGKVKVGIVPHDTVKSAVRHPDHAQRILYYVASQVKKEWDFAEHREKVVGSGQAKTVYYEAWGLREAESEAKKTRRSKPLPAPEKGDLVPGRVYHVALNKGTEAVFGTPEFRRIVPWMSSYNAFMAARVDMMKAAAAMIMKIKATGTPKQVQALAQQAITRRGALGAARPAADVNGPPMNASTVVENESATFQPFNLDSGAGNAQADASMLRSQVSAGTGWPGHYLGDSQNASLATATSLELPILKAVELRQEILEQLYRAFIDLVIERAVERGTLSREAKEPAGHRLGEAPTPDEESKAERDLSYEFALPNPLKRALGDLVTAATNVARSFDPNNTNLELSRILLQIVLADGFEVQDPAGLVKRVYPVGYIDPAVAAAMAQGQPGDGAPPDAPAQDAGALGADGDRHQADNPYGAPMKATAPEDVKAQEAALPVRAEDDVVGRQVAVRSVWEREVEDVVLAVIAGAPDNDGVGS